MSRIAALLLMIFLVSCSSNAKTEKQAEKEVVEQPTQREATPEEVAECPCGRPDWDKMPPGFATEAKPK